MKPPLRPRWAPARFVTVQTVPERSRLPWSEREKRALLASLRAQAALGLPDIQARPLRERLPRRSEAEILAFLCRLRGRAAREAVCGQYRHCLRQQRRRPAPIEVWLEVAAVLSEGLEEAVTAAFGQVFTVAGTEPLSLSLAQPRPSEPRSSQSESAPPKPRPSEPCNSQSESAPPKPRPSEHRSIQSEPIPSEPPLVQSDPLPSEPCAVQSDVQPPEPRPSEPPFVQSDPLPPEPRPSEPCAGQSDAPPPEPRPLHVDFQRVYEYLARLSRDGRGPAPPPGESLLLLALLSSLPMELGALDLSALRTHFRGVYSDLTGPPPGPPHGVPPHEPPPQGPPHGAPPPGPPPSPWGGVGLSPLNLFRVPLRLLRRRGEPSG